MKFALTFLGLFVFASSFSQIILPAFTTVYEDQRQRVILKWNHQDTWTLAYVIEKSDDNKT